MLSCRSEYWTLRQMTAVIVKAFLTLWYCRSAQQEKSGSVFTPLFRAKTGQSQYYGFARLSHNH